MLRRLLPVLLGVGVAFGASGPSARAQIVVLNARGPSAAAYPTGAILKADSVVRLKAGDRLDLLDEKGMRSLVGPETVVAGRLSQPARQRLLDMFLKADRTQAGVAGVRGFTTIEPEAAPENLWLITPSQSGPTCMPAGEQPVIWRPRTADPDTLRLTRVSVRKTVDLPWAAGQQTQPWPPALPVGNDEVYLMASDAGTNEIVWHMLPPGASGLEGLATQLVEAGCTDQLVRLRAATAASPGGSK